MAQNDLRLFGSPVRTRVLLALELLKESYPRESRVAGIRLMSTQRIVNDLERQGVLASRLRGRRRDVRLNPTYFAEQELRALLSRLAAADPILTRSVTSMRRRPRRAGKSLPA
jgi:hypothetical protein